MQLFGTYIDTASLVEYQQHEHTLKERNPNLDRPETSTVKFGVSNAPSREKKRARVILIQSTQIDGSSVDFRFGCLFVCVLKSIRSAFHCLDFF